MDAFVKEEFCKKYPEECRDLLEVVYDLCCFERESRGRLPSGEKEDSNRVWDHLESCDVCDVRKLHVLTEVEGRFRRKHGI
jgi:hypothetical protein